MNLKVNVGDKMYVVGNYAEVHEYICKQIVIEENNVFYGCNEYLTFSERYVFAKKEDADKIANNVQNRLKEFLKLHPNANGFKVVTISPCTIDKTVKCIYKDAKSAERHCGLCTQKYWSEIIKDESNS